MKILIFALTVALYGSCNNPPKDTPGQTGGTLEPATNQGNGPTADSARKNDPHDTATWEGATNDTGR
ncbi:hypothetical protein [Niabella aurantiaca]|uniref:hypothetical protein n=1 Tax=Niabella aurantiaca TaxID=379900 RepID=UPI00036A58AF|nr:hypothetical protein [Niabella aurantiaca]